jgi:hypothetical protein
MEFMFKHMGKFIAAVFILIILGWGVYGYIGYKTYTAVKTNGLKSVIENIWEGEQK